MKNRKEFSLLHFFSHKIKHLSRIKRRRKNRGKIQLSKQNILMRLSEKRIEIENEKNHFYSKFFFFMRYYEKLWITTISYHIQTELRRRILYRENWFFFPFHVYNRWDDVVVVGCCCFFSSLSLSLTLAHFLVLNIFSERAFWM